MKIKLLLDEENAVSPVIGVILMVAITVILAAVIGTFVLGLGDQVQDTAPQASFTFDYTEGGSTPSPTCTNGYGGSSGDYLSITHDGGEKVSAGQVTITDGDVSNTWADCTSLGTDSDVTAGNTAKPDAVESSDTIRVVWEASGGGDTATLGKWSGPDA